MTPAIEALESRSYRFTLHLYASSTGGDYVALMPLKNWRSTRSRSLNHWSLM